MATQLEPFTNSKKTGRLLGRLRFKKASAGKTKRRWRISRLEVEELAASYGIALDPEVNAENAEMQVSSASGYGRFEEAVKRVASSSPQVESKGSE